MTPKTVQSTTEIQTVVWRPNTGLQKRHDLSKYTVTSRKSTSWTERIKTTANFISKYVQSTYCNHRSCICTYSRQLQLLYMLLWLPVCTAGLVMLQTKTWLLYRRLYYRRCFQFREKFISGSYGR
jgi:hypothetical protein